MTFRNLLLFSVFTCYSIAFTAWSSEYQTGSQNQQAMCIVLTKQSNAALVARDWLALERIAESYTKKCKNVDDDEAYSIGYGKISRANRGLKNASKALAASDSCIQISYTNSYCHLQRIEALIMLKRVPEARIELDRADKLIKHLLEVKNLELGSANTELDRNLIEATMSNLRTEQENFTFIKNDLH